jgi:hypothetical protein
VREIRTHGLTGRGLETEPRWGLNGHEAGNGGYGQGSTYGPPRQSPTLPAAGDQQEATDGDADGARGAAVELVLRPA